MSYKVELSPGVTIDLEDGLENGDIKTEDVVPEGVSEGVNGVQEGVNAENGVKDNNEDDGVKDEEEPNLEPKPKKYTIKYNGEEKELDLSDDDLIRFIQKGYDYETKMNKLSEDRGLVEPYKRILETDWFKEKLREGLESGEIEKPTPIEKPSEEAIFEYNRKALDPDFEIIRKAMLDWALTLPEPMQYQIDNNYNVFNAEYDRIAKIIRDKKKEIPLSGKEKKKVDKIIAEKEANKSKGKIEGAGLESDVSSSTGQKRLNELRKIMKHGNSGQADEAAAEYLLQTVFSKN